DPLALGMTLAGIALAIGGRLYLASVFFVLAFLTKQTFIVAPLAVAVSLWPCRGAMLRFAGLTVAGILGSVGLAQWLTNGWFLWHTVIGNSNQPDLLTFAALVGSFLQFNGLTAVAAVASLALPSAPGERIWRVYFVGCMATLVTLAKLGASSN